MSRGQDQWCENGDELCNVGGFFTCDKCKVKEVPNGWMYEIFDNIHLCEHCLARGLMEYGTINPATVFNYNKINYALSVVEVIDKKQNRYINKKIKRELFKNAVCSYCKTENDLQIDHVIPVSKGGQNNKSNYQILCGKCNRKKSNKLPTVII